MSQSPSLQTVELTLDGNLRELPRLAGEVGRFCRAEGLSADTEDALNLALEELFANAIEHGGCAGVAGAVAIRLERSEGTVRVEFRDRGVPFDPLSAPVPDFDAPLAERAAGGLGVHFVRQIMRELQYHRCGEWNRLTMELPSARGEAER